MRRSPPDGCREHNTEQLREVGPAQRVVIARPSIVLRSRCSGTGLATAYLATARLGVQGVQCVVIATRVADQSDIALQRERACTARALP